MNITCDTNVLVSGLLWQGPPHRILQRVDRSIDRLFISKDLLAELADVLTRSKLQPVLNSAGLAAQDLVREIARLGVVVISKPLGGIVVVADPSDDQVLACAATVMVDFIVSGDHHLLELASFDGIPIVAPTHYVEHVEGGAIM